MQAAMQQQQEDSHWVIMSVIVQQIQVLINHIMQLQQNVQLIAISSPFWHQLQRRTNNNISNDNNNSANGPSTLIAAILAPNQNEPPEILKS